MEKFARRSVASRCAGIITAVFSVAFVFSCISTFKAFAASNLFKIQSAELSELSTTADGKVQSFSEDEIVSDVTFHQLNDSAKYVVTLKNTDDKDHIIESITDDNENPYVSYIYDDYANTRVNAGDSFDFVVVAKYTNGIADPSARAQATDVKFAIQFTDLAEPEVVSVSPNTGDAIIKNVIVLAVSAAGLVICAIIYAKNHKKASKLVAIAIFAVIATTITTSVKAATVEINSFTLTTNYELKDKFSVIYTDKDGNEQEIIANYNEPANIPDQSKDGYTLTHWEDEQGNPVDLAQPITEDIKIRPVYHVHTYSIKFNGNGATGSMADLAMTYDETKALPANAFNFPGRTYTGWDTEANGSGVRYDNEADVKNLTTEDNGVVTLYAQWSINPFHIDYDGNGATSGEMATTNCEYDGECVLRENAFEKTGYHFIGWKYNDTDYADRADVKNIIESGAITMVAQWEVNHYTIAFDGNGATSGNTASMAMAYDDEKNLTVNGFEKTGYTFAGWKLGDTEYADGQTVKNLTAEDGATVTLKAQWTPIHYNVAFHQNADNVSGDMSSMIVAYDESTPLTENTFALEHYKFMGWNTAEDGTGTPYEDKASIKNLTATDGATIDLYAQWKERTATLNTGANVRTALKGLADAPTTFKKYDGENLPDFDTLDDKVDIALADSNFPVWAWADGDNIYWWSEAERPNFNSNSSTMFQSMKTLTAINLDGLESSTAVNMGYLFNGCTSLTDLDISEFNTANVENMMAMFYNTPALTSIDTAVLNTANVNNMSFMFRDTGATSIDISNFNTANAKTMQSMFENTKASSIILGNPDTLKVTNMANMFQDTLNITSLDVSGLDTDNVESMGGMFEAFKGTPKLTSLNVSNFETSKVQNFACMFYGQANLTSLDVSNFDTSSATSMYMMFLGMTKAQSINVSGWTNNQGPAMNFMFSYTGMGVAGGTVINFENFNTENVTNMDHMFSDMRSEAVLDLSGFDTAKVTKMGGMFSSSYASTPMALRTVYVSDKFVTTALTGTQDNIFDNTRAIVGGAGTAWDASSMEKARIDNPDNGEPGYFTYKNARYIRYRDNDGDDTNDEANYALMTSEYLKAGDKLKKNAFVRDGYVFASWKDADNNEYTDEQVMAGLTESKAPLELYAQWKEKSSTLQSSTTVNQIMHNLNADATSFRKFPDTPTATTIENAQRISVSESNYPAYMWNDGDTLYWWSEAEKVYLSDGDSFFYNMKKLETIDVAGLDTSKVKRMTQMFMNCYALTSLDLSTFNTSAVIDMANMFSNDTALTSLNVTSFDTSKVGQMNGIFQGFAGEVLDLSSFDTSSVGGNVIAFFSTTNNLKTVYVGDKWTATNVDIPSTTPLVGGAGSTSGEARLDNPDNNSRGRLSQKSARYIRYNGNGADNATPYGAMTSEYLKAGEQLKTNAFTRSGYEFAGWKDADGNDYTDEQVVADLAESKTPLELYAQWDAKSYTVTFNVNGGEVSQSTKTVAYQQSYDELPTPVKYDYANSILGGKYSFKEWNTKADGSGDTITSSSIYASAGDTTLYAIWNDQFTVTIYNGESETPTTASYGIDDEVELHAQDVAGKQFLYWEVDGAKKAYIKDYSMHMFQGKDLTIRAVYGSESDLESQQPGTYISDIYRQYSNNKVVVRSYSYVPVGYKIVKSGVIATLDADIANGTFDDQTATYVRPESDNGNSENYYFTWSKSNVTSGQTVYVKAYLKYKDADGVEHTIYGDLVTATLTE